MKGVILCVCLISIVLGCSNDKRVHETLAMRQITAEGAAIGAVVAQLKSKGVAPFSAETFVSEYQSWFSHSWQIETNEQCLALSRQGKCRWVIDAKEGIVRSAGVADLQHTNVLDVFKHVDFSKPMVGANAPAVDAETAAEINKEWTKVWDYVRQTSKE